MPTKPLYQSIYDRVLNSIRSGEYQPNTPLPPERFLSEKFRVSRSTVRSALDKLKKDGFIYKIHGHGNYVKSNIYEQSLTQFYSFTDELRKSNILISNKIVNYEICKIDRDLALQLNISHLEDFHKLTRLRSAEDCPLMVETTYLPKSRFHKIDIDYLNTGSLYAFLKSYYNFHIDYAQEKFHPIIANTIDRSLLDITPSIPCMFLERFSYEEGSLVEYTSSVIRGDKYIFNVSLK